MKKQTVIIGFIIISVLVSLFYLIKPNSKHDAFLSQYDLDQMSVKEMVLSLEHNLSEPTGFYAGITGKSLTIGDQSKQIEIDLPPNQFYLSIAPYINQTHPCANHNLVTCRGELKNQTFDVYVEEKSTGKVVFNGQVSSSNNGFLGIWLPSSKSLEITVSQNGLEASTSITTYIDSNTCLTTLKLS